jgi:hypothetical protein
MDLGSEMSGNGPIEEFTQFSTEDHNFTLHHSQVMGAIPG